MPTGPGASFKPGHATLKRVSDLSMAGMSGFDPAQELLATRPDVPILVTSGYLRPDYQQTARADRCLTLKPDTIEELSRNLDPLLQNTPT